MTITKLVLIKIEVEIVVEVPHSWQKENVEFHRNEGTSCFDNVAQDIQQHIETKGHGTSDCCLCGSGKVVMMGIVDEKPRQNPPTRSLGPIVGEGEVVSINPKEPTAPTSDD